MVESHVRFQWRRWTVAAIAAAALVAVVASGSENEPTLADGDQDTETAAAEADAGSGEGAGSEGSEAEAEAPQSFNVGDTVELGDFTVTVNSTQIPFESGDEFITPNEGNIFITADTSVTNIGDEPATVSSIACFEVRDDTGQSYSLALVTGTPDPPDGEVGPGETIRGTLAYEVPQSATGLQLRFQCDLLSTGSAVINLS